MTSMPFRGKTTSVRAGFEASKLDSFATFHQQPRAVDVDLIVVVEHVVVASVR